MSERDAAGYRVGRFDVRRYAASLFYAHQTVLFVNTFQTTANAQAHSPRLSLDAFSRLPSLRSRTKPFQSKIRFLLLRAASYLTFSILCAILRLKVAESMAVNRLCRVS